jgi:hypothetical protein
MSHFPCCHIGNKYKEISKEFYECINLDNKNIIVEPYGGSLAMSFYIWQKNKDKNFKYIVNDNCNIIYEIYKNVKELTPGDFKNKVIESIPKVKDKESWNANKKFMNEDVWLYIAFNKLYNFRPGIYPKDRTNWDYNLTKLQREFFDFLKTADIEIYNKDWIEIFEMYCDNEKAIYLLDPPYLLSDNTYYDLSKDERRNFNIYQYIFNNNDRKFKADIYFILEYNWIISLLFKEHILIKEYGKTYDITKRKTIHQVYKLKN